MSKTMNASYLKVTKKQQQQQNRQTDRQKTKSWEMLTLYFLVLPDDKEEIINRSVSANVLTVSLQ